jgi:hypothetical protein
MIYITRENLLCYSDSPFRYILPYPGGNKITLGHLQGYEWCSHEDLLGYSVFHKLLNLVTTKFSFDDPVLIFPKALNIFELQIKV